MSQTINEGDFSHLIKTLNEIYLANKENEVGGKAYLLLIQLLEKKLNP